MFEKVNICLNSIDVDVETNKSIPIFELDTSSQDRQDFRSTGIRSNDHLPDSSRPQDFLRFLNKNLD
jgi:hypothetical protein